MRRRMVEEPVGFVAAVRLTLLAALAVAVAAGWQPDVDVATAVIVPVVAAVEGWTTWWARGAVTPEVKVAGMVAEAEHRAHIDGYRQAEDDVALLDPTRLDPTPARAERPLRAPLP